MRRNRLQSVVRHVLFAGLLATGVQAQGKFPPDSLVNVKVIPRGTSPIQLIGTMRNFSGDLGVRCQFCHVGNEGQPLDQFNFTSDEKRTKLVARQMMLMVAEINRRLDSIPKGTTPPLRVSCATCHHGVSRPAPLAAVIAESAESFGADSAVRIYRRLRERYFGSDAYNFGEASLNTAAFRLGRAGKYTDAFALLTLNEELYPNSSGMSVFRGNISLMQGDTASAERAFREAIKRDPSNTEAAGRLRAIGRPPARLR